MTSEVIHQILSGYPEGKREVLIPVLQALQSELGYLDEEVFQAVGSHVKMPAGKIYCIATFFDQFRFKPSGRHSIRICRGTSCHLFGSGSYLDEITKQLKVKPGGTSKDRKFSLEVTSCMGACDAAPVVRVDEKSYSRVTPEDLTKILVSLKEKTD